MAYPSQPGSLKTAIVDPSNEDDEFGDFTSAVTFTAVGNHIITSPFQTVLPAQTRDNPFNIPVPTNSVFFNPIPPDSDNDDEFGDFCGPTITSNSSASSVVAGQQDDGVAFSKHQDTVTKCQPNYDIDLENDLTAVSQLSWMTEELKIEEPDEEFTNFTKAEPSQNEALPVPTLVPVGNILLDTSEPQHLKSGIPSENVFPSPNVVECSHLQSPPAHIFENSETEDDFGDFTQAAVASPPVVEDLFGLDAAEIEPVMTTTSFTHETSVPSSSALDYLEADDMGTYISSANEFNTTPHINWDEPLAPLPIEESFQPTLENSLNNPVDLLPSDSKLNEVDIAEARREIEEVDRKEEEKEVAVDHVSYQQLETTIDTETEFKISPTLPESQSAFELSEATDSIQDRLAQDNQEEFGDFTDFQAASDLPVTSEDDEFDDFEAAPPMPSSTFLEPPKIQTGSSPESQVQKLLATLFPVNALEPSGGQEPIIALTNSPGGTLWSYVSQLDSTPALSFSWRHSSAHKRFLHSLQVDTMHQVGNMGYRWTSPASANSSSTVSESFTESTVTLDLDFFLNPSTSASAAVTGPSTTADSLLETIERELLSPGKDRPPFISTQSPAPVRHNQLSDIFEHLHIDNNTSTATLSSSSTVVPNRQGVVDLLQ